MTAWSLRHPLSFAASTIVSPNRTFPNSRPSLTPLRRPRPCPCSSPPYRPVTHHAASATLRKSNLRTICDQVVYTTSALPSDPTRGVAVSVKAYDLGQRLRRLSGSISIPCSLPRVWKLLTSYANLHEFVPNIVSVDVQPRRDGLYLDQVGIISRKLMLRSRMLLRVREDPSRNSVTFVRVEGRDFAKFEAVYSLQSVSDTEVTLTYEALIIPFSLYPMSLVENKALREIPKMLAAIRDEAVLAKHIPFDQT